MAIIWATLFTSLAALISASLAWQTQLAVKRAETLRDRGQAEWVAKAAVAYARWVLYEDVRGLDTRTSILFDHLGEPWAHPIARVSFSELSMPSRPADLPGWAESAFFSGGISDLHARLNLENMFPGGSVKREDALPLLRLMGFLGFDEPQFQQFIDALVQSVRDSPLEREGLTRQSDLHELVNRRSWLSRAIFKLPASAQKKTLLSSVLIWLPERTRVNINTASINVLAAVVGAEDPAEMAPIETLRLRVPIRSLTEVQGVLRSDYHSSLNRLGVASNNFLASGHVELGQLSVHFESILRRDNGVVNAVFFQAN